MKLEEIALKIAETHYSSKPNVKIDETYRLERIETLKNQITEAFKQDQALQLQQTVVMRRFLMEFMLNGKVEREEVDCENWSKAKHFIQRKYKLQDEPRVIREVKTYA